MCTTGSNEDPKDPKKSFLRRNLIFFLLGGFFCISFFFVFYFVYCRSSIDYFNRYRQPVPLELVVFNRMQPTW